MKRQIIIALALTVALVLPTIAIAQETGEPITWLAFSKTKFGKSRDAVGLTIKYDAAIYDKLMADGTVISWGVGIPINHFADDNWNMVTWATVADWNGVGLLEKGFVDASMARSEEEREEAKMAFMETFEEGSHYDQIVRHVVLSPGSEDGPAPRYINLSYYEAERGKGGAATKAFQKYGSPVFQGMQDAGDVAAYGMYVQDIHGNEDWTHVVWSMLPELGSMDAIDAAFDAAREARSEEENKEMQASFEENFTGEHSDRVLVIVHQGGSQPEEE